MHRSRTPQLSLAAAAGILLAGCVGSSPSIDFAEPVAHQAAEGLARMEKAEVAESMTWDVTKRSLEGRPWLGSDPEVRLRLELARDLTDDPARFDPEAQAILDRMIAIARQDHEIAVQGLDSMAEEDFGRAFEDLADAESTRLAALDSIEQRREWVESMIDALPPDDPHGGRFLRQAMSFPAVPFVRLWIARYEAGAKDREAPSAEFDESRAYQPDRSSDEAIIARLATASEEDLLRLYAPVVIQEVDPEAGYAAATDRLGRAEVVPDRDGEPHSRVNASQPTVYGCVTHALLDGEWLTQLNYSMWYPTHASMKPRDPEAGPVEGVMVRITLDGERHPRNSETVYACGCKYEAEEAPPPAIEHGEGGKASLAMAGFDPLVLGQGLKAGVAATCSERPDYHPRVFITSGDHQIAAVRYAGDVAEGTVEAAYELRPERELEALAWGNGRASFFGRDGLVRGADRPEALLMYPSGIYHAGTPRIREARMVRFDRGGLGDPRLLEATE